MSNFKYQISNRSTKILKISRRGEAGQTLIEVLVALTAAVIIIAAIVSASLNALTSSEFTRDQNTATSATQQGMEIIRNMRNVSIASISASYLPSGYYCLASSCSALNENDSNCWQRTQSTCSQNVGNFVRQVTVLHDSLDCNATPTPVGIPEGVLTGNVKITVTTSWYDSKCTDSSNTYCHSVVSSSCFSDFTIAPTP
ncbi:MAG TPA: prepilin-type N-terminal cleavage/methylation domain-containing protein [Candidatus Eisenbacteria bacterium]|nr:prepilin-type N-terminal cleavage/methylation domain-containing protein [Candidatus Eisenbacteria bacterium]